MLKQVQFYGQNVFVILAYVYVTLTSISTVIRMSPVDLQIHRFVIVFFFRKFHIILCCLLAVWKISVSEYQEAYRSN